MLSRNEEIVLIAIHRLEENAYGVSIRDLVSDLTGQDWTFGAIYVPLDKLTRKGFVHKTSSEPTARQGGRSKCMYTLSKDGKGALAEIRRVQNRLWDGISEKVFD
jgi:PadR family transcriptional regulator